MLLFTIYNNICFFFSESKAEGKQKQKPTAVQRYRVSATPSPQLPRVVSNNKRKVVASTVQLQSSISEPVAFNNKETVRVTNVVTAVPASTKPPPKKNKAPGPRPFRFGTIKSTKRREPRPPRRHSPGRTKNRFDLSYFANNRPKSNGGSTIVPITVTGTGIAKQTKKPSRVTPSEVVVKASQGFASLSVIDSFTNALGNPPANKNPISQNKHSIKNKLPLNPDPISFKGELPPTGLVTTLGGTIVSSGLTTVHKTSVIGTYIKGQYAQVLLSTSRIFQSSPSVNLLSTGFETVKSVIKGSATQFIKPDITAGLPLESLFTGSNNDRNARFEDEPVFFKRRGPHYRDDPFVDGLSEDDLQRSGTDLRPSFKQFGPEHRRHKRPQFKNEDRQQTFRPRFTQASTFRFSDTRTSTPHRPSSPREKRPFNRRRPGNGNRSKLITNRRKIFKKKQEEATQEPVEAPITPTPTLPTLDENGEETLQVHKSKIVDGPSEYWVEIATLRTMHTFRVGTKKNTRFVTFTKTFTHSVEPTSIPTLSTQLPAAQEPEDYYVNEESADTPLFENILDTPRDVATLPPIDIGEANLNAVLQTVTDTFSTTETMLKTSVLPVMKAKLTISHTLTQTYLVTKIVTAIKTIPPVEAFDFIPENSLNEFNDKLLAEGTENDESLLPGELEYDENSGTRVKPPPGFLNQDLAEIAGGKLNPDVLDQKLNPQLAAALKGVPQLLPSTGQAETPAGATEATPKLTPQQLQQLAYLQLVNPYAFGGFPGALQQPLTTVTSSPVTVTTDVTTTTTRVLRVIFNARPIYTTLTSTEVVRTTLTSYESATVTMTPGPQLPFGGFPFPGMPFPTG